MVRFLNWAMRGPQVEVNHAVGAELNGAIRDSLPDLGYRLRHDVGNGLEPLAGPEMGRVHQIERQAVSTGEEAEPELAADEEEVFIDAEGPVDIPVELEDDAEEVVEE